MSMARDAFDQIDAVIQTALAWHEAGQGVALATVIETWGSAPRPVGSQMAISQNGDIVGSVSGGCVEGAVVAEALAMINGAAARTLTYGVSDENAFSVGLACGGQISVYVEILARDVPVDILNSIVLARAERRAVGYVIERDQNRRYLIALDQFALADAQERSQALADSSGILISYVPPLRLTIIGAVHIAQFLAPMAQMAGYAVNVVDPRSQFATAHRFPNVTLIEEWPDAAVRALKLDKDCALVTLSHDPKLDDPALIATLKTPACYIGALGSTRTHRRRVERLTEAGFSAHDIARIRAPVGLRIGAQGPAEIAIAIMAELTQTRRVGAGGKHDK